MLRSLALASVTSVALVWGCAGPAPAPAPNPLPELVGRWRAVLASPGGDLPFTLRIDRDTVGGDLTATAINGAEEAPFSSVTREGDRVMLAIDWYDSRIDATLNEDGQRLDGRWTKTAPEGVSTLAFSAVRNDRQRFLPPHPSGGATPAAAAAAVPTVAGHWGAVFTDQTGNQKALGELFQSGDRVTGTFLTPTGDYRFLEGDYRDGRLRLSCFDGAHAFLFQARAHRDGTLAGDFWSRDNYHATWTAHRLESTPGQEAELPDPYEMVHLTRRDGHFDFSFPDLDGHRVSLSDPRFRNKVVVVNLFGSWCPNCNDEAPVLARWYRRYHDRGLEIVGLAFELTGEPDRDARFVRRYARRHGIEYPLLLAGLSDKEEAARALSDLDHVVAYPTTLLIGRDGRVRRIHSGFAGPGTGQHYRHQIRDLESQIERLLAEPDEAPVASSG